MRPIRVTPRTLEQIFEGFCSAEDIEASINCLDPAEKAIVVASFHPYHVACADVYVDLVAPEKL